MKTLIFTDKRQKSIGKYAHIIGDEYAMLYGGDIPTILSDTATMKDLKKKYTEIDFKGVELIEVVIVDKKRLQELQDENNFKSSHYKDKYSQGYALGKSRAYENIKNEDI